MMMALLIIVLLVIFAAWRWLVAFYAKLDEEDDYVEWY